MAADFALFFNIMENEIVTPFFKFVERMTSPKPKLDEFTNNMNESDQTPRLTIDTPHIK